MATEIERKFLLLDDSWRRVPMLVYPCARAISSAPNVRTGPGGCMEHTLRTVQRHSSGQQADAKIYCTGDGSPVTA